MPTSRREFLRGLGIAGLGLAVSPLLARLGGPEPKALAASEKKKITRQWVRVVDLKKCDGCEWRKTGPACTEVCRSTYHPLEGQEWIKVSKVEGEGGSSYWMPFPCMHCENAPCVNVCPVGASYHNENGLVLIDHRKCIGCRLCMAACPYQRRYFNWKEAEPPKNVFAEYSPEYPVPPIKGTVAKCVFCAHFLEIGMPTMCTGACPRGALYFGDKERDVITNGREMLSLSKTLAENNAFRYKEELGTEPRVYYLPGYGQESGREARG